MAYLEWLNNHAKKAAELFERSAQADTRWGQRNNLPFHRAKAAMSRSVAARAATEALAMSAEGPADPTPSKAELESLAEKLKSAQTEFDAFVRGLTRGQAENDKQAENATRFQWVGWFHLAQTRAWLGDESGVQGILPLPRGLGRELDRSAELMENLVKAELDFVQGRLDEVVALLEGKPQHVVERKAGEGSGIRAQLLARAYRGLGRMDDFKRWCGWLAEECPRDAGNGPAIDWARANLDQLGQKGMRAP